MRKRVRGPQGLMYGSETIATEPSDDQLPPSVEGSYDGDYDAEHLEVWTPASSQGTVDTITEGTISVPHSHDAMLSDQIAEQHEVNDAIARVADTVKVSAVDTLWARRMKVHRFRLFNTQPSSRLLQANHARRYFMISIDIADNTAQSVYLSDQPINVPAGITPDNAFVLIGLTGQTLMYGPFFHQGELWGLGTSATVPAAFSVIEYFGT